jgi:hypothetical protein
LDELDDDCEELLEEIPDELELLLDGMDELELDCCPDELELNDDDEELELPIVVCEWDEELWRKEELLLEGN